MGVTAMRKIIEYNLSSTEIAECISSLEELLKDFGVNKQDIIRHTLSVENLCLDFREHFGEESGFVLEYVKRFGSLLLSVRFPGMPWDPLSLGDRPLELSTRDMISRMNVSPAYTYTRNENVYTMSILRPKKIGGMTQILIAIALGLTTGFLLRMLPAGTQATVRMWVDPVCSTLMDFIVMAALPMMFFAVINAICDCGSLDQLRRIGKWTIGLDFVIVFIALVCTTVISLIAFPL